ncbi:SusD/RagB family nutrient-binding outer membrane lipoprotein [Aureispira sp. CCB-E]|uniref:SusD/RagB family nutrient-binding outer membrane lipoprotein n=1 Tax=Aureispira sp. CCB-E TaxID=3051121 RepID=UPI0028685F0D|nr:SusD/RagB family nutrient-binding outer membrane lipoprotein [Aureispira sp. CCB-E]WMX15887.1 SusD/RagB family nutrient-binding outer membrane lipoprotein [Aureispira sp. CCB-E]
MNYKIYILLLACLSFGSCSKEFEKINTNPNAPEQVDAQFLLSNILWNAANNNAVDAWNAGNFLAQLTAKHNFNEIDRYDIRTNTELWNKTYLLLNDVKSLETLAENGNQTYKGVALVMRAFLFATLTDLWGDVPYSEAIKGTSDNNFSPKYDTQEEIYTGNEGILQTLRDAVTILDGSRNNLPIKGDLIYNGNVDQWIRFANSLRVRYLLRVSNKINVATEMQTIVSSNLLMQSNMDNSLVPYLATAPSQWFVHTIREGDYSGVRMSSMIDSVLTNLNDPRLQVWFKPTSASVGMGMPVYKSIPNGLGPASIGQYDLADVSTLGAIFRDQPAGVNAVLMLYSELQFALAEAAQRGLIGGSAQMYYENGIQASFDYYNTTMPSNYLVQSEVAWDGSLSKIITQKWLASMLVGYEGWFNYRRTGFPVLKQAVDNVNNDMVPVRYRYPDTEKAVNPNNYNAAVSRIGGDTYNIKVWWDKP